MSTQVGVIKKFVKTLIETKSTGIDAIDEAFKAVGATSYRVFRENIYSAQTGYYSYKDFLEQACGVRITNTDTGAITGSDAGGKTSKTAESILPETAKAKSLSKTEYNSFTKNGLTVNVTYKEKNDNELGENFNYSGETYLEKQKLVVRALYNWWIPESLDLINESLGINFTDGRANINTINIVFESSDRFNSNEAIRLDFNYDMGLASEVTLKINSDSLYKMTANDKNGTLDGDRSIRSELYRDYYGNHYDTDFYTNYLDRLILQSMAEITLKANVPYFHYLPAKIRTGLCEIVGGYDDSSTEYWTFAYQLKEDANGLGSLQREGYTYLRYLAKNYSDGMPDGVSYNSNKTTLTLTTDYMDSTLDLADFASTVKKVNASALKKGIKIIGNAKDNSIRGGKGDDKILGGKGKDSLSGGDGKDTLSGGKGDDKILGDAGNDSLSGGDGKDTLSGGKGDDKILGDAGNDSLSGGDGKDTLSGGKGDDKILGDAGNDSLSGGAGKDTLSGGKGDDKILGDAGNDSLSGGAGNDILKGGSGNDSLWGGAGNDSLWGGDGNDTFIYAKGDGKDILYGFDSTDMLKITESFSTSYSKSNKEIYFKVGSTSNAITLKDFGSTKTFNVNGISYKLGSTKLVRK